MQRTDPSRHAIIQHYNKVDRILYIYVLSMDSRVVILATCLFVLLIPVNYFNTQAVLAVWWWWSGMWCGCLETKDVFVRRSGIDVRVRGPRACSRCGRMLMFFDFNGQNRESIWHSFCAPWFECINRKIVFLIFLKTCQKLKIPTWNSVVLHAL